jgi:pilus assembly protein CpaB
MRHLSSSSFMLPLLFAVLAAGATFLALNRPATPGSAAPQTQRIAVAARAIDAGSGFGANDVTFNEMPSATVPGDAVHDLSELKDAFASAPIPKGSIVRRANVSVTPLGSHLSTLIPSGMVAVSIAVSDVINTGGFVIPGDHVDVLGIISKEATDSATIVLRDVQVLAVASALLGDTPSTNEAKKAIASATGSPQTMDSTVTLAVTIQDAQRLVQVDEVGKLRLALLRPASSNASSGAPLTSK